MQRLKYLIILRILFLHVYILAFLWVFPLLGRNDSKYEQEMKDIPDLMAPMQEKIIEDLLQNEVIQSLYKFMAEDLIVSIDDDQHLLQQKEMIRLKDAPHSSIEVVIVKFVGQLLVVFQDDLEIALYEVQALKHAVGFVEMSFGEDEHHESIEQLFILYHLYVAFGHLIAVVHQLVVIHLSYEERKQISVFGKVLPHYLAIVVKRHLGLVPQHRVQAEEQLIVVPVEQQFSPLLISFLRLLQRLQLSDDYLVLFNLSVETSFPIIEIVLGRAFEAITGPYFSQFLLSNNRIIRSFQGIDDLILAPWKFEVDIGDKPMDKHALLMIDAIFGERYNLLHGKDDKLIKLDAKFYLQFLVANGAEIFQRKDVLMANLINDIPDILILHLFVRLQEVYQRIQQLQQNLLNLQDVIRYYYHLFVQLSQNTFQKQVEDILAGSIVLEIYQFLQENLKSLVFQSFVFLMMRAYLSWCSHHYAILAEDHEFHLLSIQLGSKTFKLKLNRTYYLAF